MEDAAVAQLRTATERWFDDVLGPVRRTLAVRTLYLALVGGAGERAEVG